MGSLNRGWNCIIVAVFLDFEEGEAITEKRKVDWRMRRENCIFEAGGPAGAFYLLRTRRQVPGSGFLAFLASPFRVIRQPRLERLTRTTSP